MKKTILAVDDVSSILTVISSVFLDSFNVVKKTNAKDALEYLYSGNVPEVVITDLQMPDMNGFELIQEIKSSGLLKNIPIVVLSGQNNSAERVKCLKMGVDEYMIKPFNPEELRLRTINLLDRSLSKLS